MRIKKFINKLFDNKGHSLIEIIIASALFVILSSAVTMTLSAAGTITNRNIEVMNAQYNLMSKSESFISSRSSSASESRVLKKVSSGFSGFANEIECSINVESEDGVTYDSFKGRVE